MATNRLMLRCTVCGEDVVIARLSAGGDVWEPARQAPPVLEDFLSTHSQHDYRLHVELVGESEQFLDLTRTDRPDV